MDERADEQRRAEAETERRNAAREHETELLLRRRAEAARAGENVQTGQRNSLQPASPAASPLVAAAGVDRTNGGGTQPDLRTGLLVRAIGIGVLSGAAAVVLGKIIQRRFRHE